VELFNDIVLVSNQPRDHWNRYLFPLSNCFLHVFHPATLSMLATTSSWLSVAYDKTVYVNTWSCNSSSCTWGQEVTSISFSGNAVVAVSPTLSYLSVGIPGTNYLYSCTTSACTLLLSETGTSKCFAIVVSSSKIIWQALPATPRPLSTINTRFLARLTHTQEHRTRAP